MNIGFDAKRAFHNRTGLGHYSRNLLLALATYYTDHEYYLFNPRQSGLFQLKADNLHEVLPNSFFNRIFHSAWRSSWVKKDLQKLKIELYHGLSHEIPRSLHLTGIKSVVTIHDLIFERYPEQYSKVDVAIYRNKFRHACSYADRVIAISEQTKKDIIEFYKTREQKISVCYQSCHPAFGERVSEEKKKEIRTRYNLPDQFFLYVGSVIERKNLLNICKALFLLRSEVDVPLVVIGDGGRYKQQVKDYVKKNVLEEKILFLSEQPMAKSSASFQSGMDFPAIYQSALAMIYPSFYEGFGIPVLEALWSRLPVITSNLSCLPEAGGEAAYYVDPGSEQEIAAGMKKIYSDPALAASMKDKGWQQAQKFTAQSSAAAVMNVYQTL